MKKVNVVVKKAFLDKYTGLTHKAGQKLALSAARIREINRLENHVEVEKVAIQPKESIKKESK